MAVIASLSVGVCNATKPDTNSYEGIVSEAKAQHSLAKKTYGNVWKQKKMKKSYVDTYLAKADKAKKAGKDADALKFAKQARDTAVQEVKQMSKKDHPAWIK